MPAKSKAKGKRKPAVKKKLPEKLSPLQAQKTLDMEFANLAKKVRDGRTLTQAERVALHQYANQGKDVGGESGPGAPVDVVRSKTKLADALGVSRRTLQNHWNDPGRPNARSDGAYDLLSFRQWAIAAGFGKAEEMGGEELPTKQELEARHLLVRIDIAQLNLAQKRKELIPRKDHRQGLRWLASIFVNALDDLPERLGLLGVSLEGVEIAEAECQRTKQQVQQVIEKG